MADQNSRIEVGHFEADGSAVALSFSSVPNALIAWNETKFATTAKNVIFLWTDAYSAGDGSLILNDTTNGMMGVKETTNAFTATSSVSYSDSGSNTLATKTETLTFGTAVCGDDSDEVHYIAFWGAKGTTDHGDQA